MRFLRWPLVVGETWTFQLPLASGRTFEYHAPVDRWEEVTVPAGRFKAVVVELKGQASGPQGTTVTTVWFAPDAKWTVKQHVYGTRGSHIVPQELWELERFELH